MVVNVFNEFQRQGLVSEYKMGLQDLLMEVAGKQVALGSDIKFGCFNWAVKILSLYNSKATIAQVLLSLNTMVNIVAIIIFMDSFFS